MTSLTWVQVGFLALVFVSAGGLVLGVFDLLRRSEARDRLQRLIGGNAAPAPEPARTAWVETVAKLAKPLAKLSIPEEGWEESGLRRRFMQAGLRTESAPVVYYGLKTALGFGLPVIAWMVVSTSGSNWAPDTLVVLLVMLLCAGFYAPNLLLERLLKKRKLEIFEGFPDAIDLLTICVEAGLSLEAGIARVAQEIRLKSEALADELQLVSLEFRAGATKERALRNFALRTGVEDVDTLVAMLIQSEKFGTSVGDSLRIHSDMLRTKRMQRAEEAAARIAVKLVIPLVICIFPSILIVVAGPAIISISKTLPLIFGGR